MPKQIICIGRGHSGTRALGGTLFASGIPMGSVNESYDFIPGDAMYRAARMAGVYVDLNGYYDFDFTDLLAVDPPERFVRLVREYLAPFAGWDVYAWKLPEATLALPWLVKMFPDAYYIHWIRDGRDNILKSHDTERLLAWNIPTVWSHTVERRTRAAVSWKYHMDIVEATPKPEHWLEIRLCDFVQVQGKVLERLGDYLGQRMNVVPVFPDVIGRWKTEHLDGEIQIMERQLKRYNYL